MQIDQWINETVAPISGAISATIFYSVPLAEGVDLPIILNVELGLRWGA